MDNSVVSTIEKIKLQEQDKEAKLKEKRELEATIASLNRAIRDAISATEKSSQERLELLHKTDKLKTQVELERIRNCAFEAQLKASTSELQDLRVKFDEGITRVWRLRTSLCDVVHAAANECDVWALLMKPVTVEPLPRNTDAPPTELTLPNEGRLRSAKERREKAIAERDRLKCEPDTGEEFIRKFLTSHRATRLFSSKIEANENEPIKFSTSGAAKRKVLSMFRQPQADSMPMYQPFVVVGSVAVFLIYFCVLREESDVDQEFNKTLYDRIKGLEKEQLLQSYRYNKENGIGVTDIEKRLKELEEIENKQQLAIQ